MNLNLVIILLIFRINCQVNPKEKGEDKVIYLNNNNINNLISHNSKRIIISLFYDSNNCVDNCKKLLETYYHFSYDNSINNKEKIISGLVDCSVEKNLCSKFFFMKYPSLILIHNKLIYRYEHDEFNLGALKIFLNKGYLENSPMTHSNDGISFCNKTKIVFSFLKKKYIKIMEGNNLLDKILANFIIFLIFCFLIFCTKIFLIKPKKTQVLKKSNFKSSAKKSNIKRNKSKNLNSSKSKSKPKPKRSNSKARKSSNKKKK